MKKPDILTEDTIEACDFAFDGQQTFKVGSDSINLQSIDPFTMRVPETTINDEYISASAVLLSYLGFIGTPRLRKWATNMQQTDAAEIRTIMRRAYNLSSGNDFGAETEGGGFGFDVGTIRPGHLVFSVLGDCAYMGVIPDSFVVPSGEWDTNFTHFAFHNIDQKAQGVSLLAGLGYASLLASRSE